MAIGIGSGVGIVVVDHGSRRGEGNDVLHDVVEQLAAEWPGVIVEPAHMELAEPTIAAAFDACVRRGASHVIVAPFFLAPGRHWTEDIPQLSAEAAARHPAVTFRVARPLGSHPLMTAILRERIEQCTASADRESD